MKRAFFVTVLAIATALPVASAVAQINRSEQPKFISIPHNFQIFLEGGGAIPSKPGEFKEYWNSAFAIGLGGGISIFPWLEVNGGLQHFGFSVNTIKTKQSLNDHSINGVEGGTITTNIFSGSARFIAVPKQRTNPYAEVAVGYYKTTAQDLTIEGALSNSMEGASGLSVAPSVGIQYTLNEYWGAYIRYTYTRNLSSTFTPGDLLQPENGVRAAEPSDQVIQAINVGVMVRF